MTAEPLMAGKKGLIMGLANDKSIAWGIAQALDAQGAQIAISYQNEALEKRVVPLAEKLSFAPTLIKCDVTDSASVEACFKELGEKWGKIDFVVHAIAFSDKDQLKGRTIDTTLENFTNTMHISCYSFLEACRCASPYMNENGAIVTLTYLGSERVLPNYNIMGVAKAALEARYVMPRLIWDSRKSASMRFPPARLKRWPLPASAISARFCAGTN